MEVKFGDSEKVQEILQVITPLKEIILCSMIVKDISSVIGYSTHFLC